MNGNWTPAEEAIAALSPGRRTDAITSLIGFAVWLAIHTDVPIPDRIDVTIPVRGDDRAEREENVRAAAPKLGSVVARDGHGHLYAAHQFGILQAKATSQVTWEAAA
jgi:hypothetical protein